MSDKDAEITDQLLQRKIALNDAISHLRSLKYYKRSVESHQRNFKAVIASLNKAINKLSSR